MSETQRQGASGEESSRLRKLGQLVVVGTGIQWAGQTTLAARRAIELADAVLFAVADPWAARWIRELNANASSLSYPRAGVARHAIYRAMVDRILAELGRGQRVCAVFYGSPAVLTRPAHEAIRRAREAGHAASMLPGVCFLDCLFADLALDPGEQGVQVFEAGDFLLRARQQDTSSHLVLSQIGLIANPYAFDPNQQELIRGSLQLLARRLLRDYAEAHPVVLYEAAALPGEPPRVERIPLGELARASVSGISTLYVPPLRVAEPEPEMQAALAALRASARPASASELAGVSPELSESCAGEPALTAGGGRMKKIVNELERLEQAVRATKDERDRAESYRKLGLLESTHGLAEAGLEDALEGYRLLLGAKHTQPDLRGRLEREEHAPSGPEEFVHLLQLGEALRVKARDVDFSAGKDGLPAVVRTMRASLRCFDGAISLLKSEPPKEQQAWAYAHRGAARTMGYWLKKTLGSEVAGGVFGAEDPDGKGGLFELALDDYERASRLRGGKYPWCDQFKAFHYTIRGKATDFDLARKLIDGTREGDDPLDSSLERSLSILHFNLLGKDSAERVERARDSLEHALIAQKEDSENFVAAFYAAASMRVLALEYAELAKKGSKDAAAEYEAKSNAYERLLGSAIQNARLRAENIISQAYASLVGLAVLDSTRGEKVPVRGYLEQALSHTPDLETRIVFDRAIQQLLQLPNVDPVLKGELKEFLDAHRSARR